MRLKRVTLNQVKAALDYKADSIQAQINRLKELYYLEIDELDETEDEPEWVAELGRQIDALESTKEELYTDIGHVKNAIAEAQFRAALRGAFNFLMSHLE